MLCKRRLAGTQTRAILLDFVGGMELSGKSDSRSFKVTRNTLLLHPRGNQCLLKLHRLRVMPGNGMVKLLNS